MDQITTHYRKLVENITKYYEEFGYPSDMDNLIYYMPIEKGVLGGDKEIIKKFHQFLIREEKYIKLKK